MFLPQAGRFYVLIAWGFHQKPESANSAVCEQGGYICGTGTVPGPAPSRPPGAAWLETKQVQTRKLMLLQRKV